MTAHDVPVARSWAVIDRPYNLDASRFQLREIRTSDLAAWRFESRPELSSCTPRIRGRPFLLNSPPMPELRSGSHVGPYQILAPIGAGGMGEVYRARDTKLKRDVAIKILPSEWAHDPERLARAQREAEVLASLNHPHIAQIYGHEQAAGSLCLVLEFVDGETLQERLKGGPIPLAEALEIASQIADALDAAHEGGVVHRDLKPANIKITPQGQVKVLDFGLA